MSTDFLNGPISGYVNHRKSSWHHQHCACLPSSVAELQFTIIDHRVKFSLSITTIPTHYFVLSFWASQVFFNNSENVIRTSMVVWNKQLTSIFACISRVKVVSKFMKAVIQVLAQNILLHKQKNSRQYFKYLQCNENLVYFWYW